MIDPVEDALLVQTVGSTALAAESVSFTTTGAWTSQVVPVSTKGAQPMWVSISPDHGDEAGTYTLEITLEPNDTGDDSSDAEVYDVSLQNGRATQALLKGEYESWDIYKHTFSYNDDGYLIRTENHSTDYGAEGANIGYTDGVLTALTFDGEGEDDDNLMLDPDTYYPHKYPNDRTNIDFNMFLLNGTPELENDIVSLLVSLRMCGKFGDSCVEIGGGGDEYHFSSPISYVSDPDYSEHVSTTGTKVNNGLWNAVYEFDADGSPVKISFDVVYDVFNIEYDKVAESFPFNPNEGGRPSEGEGSGEVWYRVTTKNYTETKTGEIKCPAVYTITYNE